MRVGPGDERVRERCGDGARCAAEGSDGKRWAAYFAAASLASLRAALVSRSISAADQFSAKLCDSVVKASEMATIIAGGAAERLAAGGAAGAFGSGGASAGFPRCRRGRLSSFS